MLYTNEMFTPQELMRINLDRAALAINMYKECGKYFNEDNKEEIYTFIYDLLSEKTDPSYIIDFKTLN